MNRWTPVTEAEAKPAGADELQPLQPLTQHERDCAKVYGLQAEIQRRQRNGIDAAQCRSAQARAAERALQDWDGAA